METVRKVLSNLLPEIKFHHIDKQNGHLLFDTPDGIVPLHCLSDGYLADDLRAAQVGILKKASSGNALKLLGHTERTSDRIGFAHTSGRIPMIDMIHRVMKLWEANESAHINAYFHEHGLQENPLFKAVVQALIETSPQGASERSLLETLINYEPGEPGSGVSFANPSTKNSELQLTMDDILSK